MEKSSGSVGISENTIDWLINRDPYWLINRDPYWLINRDPYNGLLYNGLKNNPHTIG